MHPAEWQPHDAVRQFVDHGGAAIGELIVESLRPALHHPRADERPPQRMHKHRQRPHVIGQFLALVAQRLNLGLRRRIGNG